MSNYPPYHWLHNPCIPVREKNNKSAPLSLHVPTRLLPASAGLAPHPAMAHDEAEVRPPCRDGNGSGKLQVFHLPVSMPARKLARGLNPLPMPAPTGYGVGIGYLPSENK